MSGIPRADPKQFIQCAPILHVEDIQQMVSFYCNQLGFQSDFGDAHYAVASRKNAAIHFTRGSTERPVSTCLSGYATSMPTTQRSGLAA